MHTLRNAAVTHLSHTLILKIFSLDNSYAIDLLKLFSIDDIPVPPNLILAKCKLKEMPHLRDLALLKIDGASVTLLIEADVAQLFCAVAFRKGRRSEAVAIKTPLGWSLLWSSLSLSSTQNCKGNFVKHKDKPAEQQIQTIWFANFEKRTTVLDMPFSREDRLMCKLLQNFVKMVNSGF